MIRQTQGNSYTEVITSPSVELFDADWGGRWAIVPEIGSPAVAAGVLTVAADNRSLLLKIRPGDTLAVTPRQYLLVVEVTNTVLEFCKEIKREPFLIEALGIPA